LLEIEIEQLGEWYSPSRTRKFGKKETNKTCRAQEGEYFQGKLMLNTHSCVIWIIEIVIGIGKVMVMVIGIVIVIDYS
jgi:hypothetical protein